MMSLRTLLLAALLLGTFLQHTSAGESWPPMGERREGAPRPHRPQQKHKLSHLYPVRSSRGHKVWYQELWEENNGAGDAMVGMGLAVLGT